MDDRVEQYVARALEDRAAGRAVDLTMICADRQPERKVDNCAALLLWSVKKRFTP